MQAILPYLYAFLVGGAFCLIGQVLIDRTKLTPARILSGYVVAGVLLGALGWYPVSYTHLSLNRTPMISAIQMVLLYFQHP